MIYFIMFFVFLVGMAAGGLAMVFLDKTNIFSSLDPYREALCSAMNMDDYVKLKKKYDDLRSECRKLKARKYLIKSAAKRPQRCQKQCTR